MRIALGHRVRIFAHLLLLNLRPEFYERKRTVETDIGGAVIKIIKAFEIGKSVCILCRGVVRIRRALQFVGPDRAAVRQHVKFVEELTAIPCRLRFVLYIRLLPLVNLAAPLLVIFESVARDLPGIGPGSVEEAGVVTQPFAPASKLLDRKIPRERHRNRSLLMCCERKADRDGTGHLLATACEIRGEIGKLPIFRKGPPDFGAGALGIEVGEVGNLRASRGEGCDCELAIPLFGYGAVTQAIENDALHLSARQPLRTIDVAVLIVQNAIEIS